MGKSRQRQEGAKIQGKYRAWSARKVFPELTRKTPPLLCLLLCLSCALEGVSFPEAPPPSLLGVSPAVAAPGARVVLFGENLDLTPEDPDDLPGGERPTPFDVTVTIAGQKLSFDEGDVLTPTALTIKLPELPPGVYAAQVTVEGQTSNVIGITIDTVLALRFAASDPVILNGLGGGTILPVVGIGADGSILDVSNEVEFEVSPPDALAIGRTGAIAALRSGDAVLTARRGRLSTSITVRVMADGDFVTGLLAPPRLALAPGEEIPLPLTGRTALGRLVDLAPASRLTVEGDEAALPVVRDTLGRPFLQALEEGSAVYTFTLGDGSLGTVSIPVESSAARRAALLDLSLSLGSPLFPGAPAAPLTVEGVYDLGAGPPPEPPSCAITSGTPRAAVGLSGAVLALRPGDATLSCSAGGVNKALSLSIADNGDAALSLNVSPQLLPLPARGAASFTVSLQTENGRVVDATEATQGASLAALLAGPGLVVGKESGVLTLSAGALQTSLFLDTPPENLIRSTVLALDPALGATSVAALGENILLSSSRKGAIFAIEEGALAPREVAAGLPALAALATQGNLLAAAMPAADAVGQVQLAPSSFGEATRSGTEFRETGEAPTGVAIAPDGALFAARADGTITRISPEGEQTTIAQGLSAPGVGIASRFPSPAPGPLAYDPAEDILYIIDSTAGKLFAIDGARAAENPVAPREILSLPGIEAVALGKQGLVAVGSRLTGAVLFLASNGDILGGIDTGVGPGALRSLALAEEGALYVLEDKQHTLIKIGVAP